MLLAIQAQHSTKENWFWTLLTPMVIYGSIKTFIFLNLVGFNLEMLYTETDKGDLGQKIIFKSFSIQCPKRSKTAFVVRENHLT